MAGFALYARKQEVHHCCPPHQATGPQKVIQSATFLKAQVPTLGHKRNLNRKSRLLEA